MWSSDTSPPSFYIYTCILYIYIYICLLFFLRCFLSKRTLNKKSSKVECYKEWCPPSAIHCCCIWVLVWPVISLFTVLSFYGVFLLLFFSFFFRLFLCLWFVTGEKKMHHQCTRGILEQTWGKSQTEGDERTRERKDPDPLLICRYMTTFFFPYSRDLHVCMRVWRSLFVCLRASDGSCTCDDGSKSATGAVKRHRKLYVRCVFFFFCSRFLPFIFAYFDSP